MVVDIGCFSGIFFNYMTRIVNKGFTKGDLLKTRLKVLDFLRQSGNNLTLDSDFTHVNSILDITIRFCSFTSRLNSRGQS